MKTIGIIGAMEEEIASLKERIGLTQTKNMAGLDFFMGKMQGKNVVIVRSGIGKVNAAVCVQVMIDFYGTDYVINVGVAGALNKRLNIGDVVVSTDLVQHDMDATAFGYEKGVIPRLGEKFFKADEELVKIAGEAGGEVLKNKQVMKGRVASGDIFVSDAAEKKNIRDVFRADCVEMEGAAMAQVCHLNSIPFVAIRAISDKADGEATVSFEKFVIEASQSSSDLVERMVLLLS